MFGDTAVEMANYRWTIKRTFPDEIPEREKSSSFDVPLEDEEEEYDIHPNHAPSRLCQYAMRY